MATTDCNFYRGLIADPHLTDHDLHLVAEHMKICRDCQRVIGRMLRNKS